jgi:alkylhydroperoxidase family enzyme
MRIDIPADQEPMVFIWSQIASPQLRGMLQSLTQILHASDSTVTPKEREAIRYYLAYREDCNACANFRAGRDIPGYSSEVISEEWYDQIPNYHTWSGFTDRERLAIEFSSRFVDDHLDVERDDNLWLRLQRNFTQREIEDLVVISAFAVAGNRIREVLLGPTRVCPAEPASARSATTP